MVKDVLDWQWSSYPAMIGREPVPEWFETDWLLSQFGQSRSEAIGQYKDFVRQGIGLAPIWQGLKQQMYLGSGTFINKMQTLYATDNKDTSLKEIPRLQRRSFKKELNWYDEKYTPCGKAMATAFLSGDHTMKEIADWFGVHYSTVNRGVKKVENA